MADPESAIDTNRCPPGVYRSDAPHGDRGLPGGGFPESFAIVALDAADITDRDTFLGTIARVLRFPDYFGGNLDALYDCLTDPPAEEAAGSVLVITRVDGFARSDPGQWAAMLRVFRDACAYRQGSRNPLYVIVIGAVALGPDARPLPTKCQTDGA